MRILVTGGAGFIGSHLVKRLIKDHQVIVVDDLSGGFEENLNGPFYKVDCRNAEQMDLIFEMHRPEIVFHLACNAAEQKSLFSPIDITSRNYDAFIKTVTPAIKYGVKRFVFVSSIAVYGALQSPFKETDEPKPEDLYGVSKLACEESLKILSEVHGFEYVIARPHNVYGPRQNMTDPYRNVVTIWMNALLNGQKHYIYGDGNMERCFSYIDDVADALYKCGFENVASKTFNIGSDKSYTLNGLDLLLYQIADYKDSAEYLPERTNEVKIAISDHTECKQHLGYHETQLEEGLKKTWEWCKSKGAVEPIKTGFEIMSEKIPRNWL